MSYYITKNSLDRLVFDIFIVFFKWFKYFESLTKICANI